MLLERLKNSIRRNGLRSFLRQLDMRFGLGRIEYVLNTNWFNPLATIWLNFRSFPLSQAILLPIWIYGHPRLYCLSGKMEITSRIKSGMIRFNLVRSGSPCLQNLQSELQNCGHIIFDGAGIIGTGTRIFVEQNGILRIGRDFKICDMTNIGCMRSIIIGNNSWITHRCQIMDSNYHFVANFNKYIVTDRTQPIVIGDGCWIGNTTTITGGANVPNYTIVGSHSLINKSSNSTPESSMIGGVPAKLIASGFRRIDNREVENSVREYYKNKQKSPYKLADTITMQQCSEM